MLFAVVLRQVKWTARAWPEILDVDLEAIRVMPTACGGGFGSKIDISFQPYVALAAWKLDQACPDMLQPWQVDARINKTSSV